MFLPFVDPIQILGPFTNYVVTSRFKTGKKCIFCVFESSRQPDDHIGWVTSLFFPSIHFTNPISKSFSKKYWVLAELKNPIFLSWAFGIFGFIPLNLAFIIDIVYFWTSDSSFRILKKKELQTFTLALYGCRPNDCFKQTNQIKWFGQKIEKRP